MTTDGMTTDGMTADDTTTEGAAADALRVAMVTFDATDARALAAWWADRTRGRVVADHGGEFLMVAPGSGGPVLGFQRVDDPTPGKNRVHLDLTTSDREAEVRRLQAAGARFVARHETPGFTWVVLADPEGNQFCVSGEH